MCPSAHSWTPIDVSTKAIIYIQALSVQTAMGLRLRFYVILEPIKRIFRPHSVTPLVTPNYLLGVPHCLYRFHPRIRLIITFTLKVRLFRQRCPTEVRHGDRSRSNRNYSRLRFDFVCGLYLPKSARVIVAKLVQYRGSNTIPRAGFRCRRCSGRIPLVSAQKS